MKQLVNNIKAEVKSFCATMGAIGAVRLRGMGALQSYPGQVEGVGFIKRMSGKDKGKKDYFKLGATIDKDEE